MCVYLWHRHQPGHRQQSMFLYIYSPYGYKFDHIGQIILDYVQNLHTIRFPPLFAGRKECVRERDAALQLMVRLEAGSKTIKGVYTRYNISIYIYNMIYDTIVVGSFFFFVAVLNLLNLQIHHLDMIE